MNKFSFEKPGLLVSVRNAAEAQSALAGGADIIDVKEPDRGPLGMANGDTIADVVRAVNGRALVTVAMGELTGLMTARSGDVRPMLERGVSLFKIGLAGCATEVGWRSRWQEAINWLMASSPTGDARPVAVVYADWLAARSPAPRDVLVAAIEFGCPALLIDTWSKTTGSLFDHWPIEDLQNFLVQVRSNNLAIVIAGSLTGAKFADAAQLGPDLIAVRAAACDGGRSGAVTVERVDKLKQALREATKSLTPVA